MQNEYYIELGAKIDEKQHSDIQQELRKLAESFPDLEVDLSNATADQKIIVEQFKKARENIDGVEKTVTQIGLKINGLSKSFKSQEITRPATESLQQIVDNMQQLQQKLNQAIKSGQTELANELRQQIQTLNDEFQKVAFANADNLTISDVDNIYSKFANLQKIGDSIQSDAQIKQSQAALKEYVQYLNKYSQAVVKVASLEKQKEQAQEQNQESIEEEIQAYKRLIQMYEEAMSSAKSRITTQEDMTRANEKQAEAEEKVNAKMAELNRTVDESNDKFIQLGDMILNSLVNRAMMALEQQLTQAVQQVFELNKALTDVQIVTGYTSEQMYDLANQYSKMAGELGATTAEVAAGSSEWLRQGKTASETSELLQASMVMQKVGAIEAQQATELLTSTMNGYKMEVEEVMHVVDALSAVDLAAATQVEEIAVAMQKTANTARIAGVEFEELVGYIAAVSEATRQQPEIVGTSFRQILSRYTNVAAGKDVDDYGEQLNDVEKTLRNVGIEIRDTQGNFRDFSDVLDDIYHIWDKVTDAQRNQIKTAVAGTRQSEAFVAIMENYGNAMDYVGIATESDGMAMEKFSIYTENLEAKINSLKAAFENLVYDKSVVEFFGEAIDALTTLINVINKIVENPLGRLLVGFAAITVQLKALSGVIAAIQQSSVVSGIVSTFTALQSGQMAATASVGGLSVALSTLYVAAPWIAGVAVAFTAIYELTNGFETQAEKVERLQREYDDITTTIEDLNKQLDDNNQKIEELNKLKSETKDDTQRIDGETEALKRQNTQLAIQLELEERRQKQVNEEKNREQLKLANNTKKENESQVLANLNITGEDIVTQEDDYIQAAIDKLNEYQRELDIIKEKFQSGEYSKSEEDRYNVILQRYQDLENALSDFYNQEMERKQLLEDIGGYEEEIEGIDALTDVMADYLGISEEVIDKKNELAQGSNYEPDQEAQSFNYIASELQDVLDKYQLLISAQQEVNETGMLSLETIQSMAESYPELQEQLQLYMMGLSTEQELLQKMQEYYSIDEQNYVALLEQKLANSEQFYNSMGFMDTEFVNNMLENYGVDLQNAKTYAEAKRIFEQQVINAAGEQWADFFNWTAEEQQRHINAMLNSTNFLDNNIGKRVSVLAEGFEALTNTFKSAQIQTYTSRFNALKSSIEDTAKATDKASDSEDRYNDLLQMTINMLKQKAKDQKEALQQELEAYKKIIDARKELLDKESDDRSYNNEVDQLNKEISDLEDKIYNLSLDGSRDAIAQKIQLEEELAEKRQELEDKQYEHQIDSQKDALDKEYDNFEENINQRIDAIDQYLSHTGEITAEAIRLINEHADSTYRALVEWNAIYGDSLEQTVYDAWWYNQQAVNSYTNTVGQIPSTQPIGTDIASNVTNGWINANRELEKYLNNLSKVGGMQKVDVPDWNYTGNKWNDIVWNDINSRLYGKHHGGLDSGVVGDTGGNEVFVKALKGEAFVTKYQQDKFMNKVLPETVSNFTENNDKSIVVEKMMEVNVSGQLDDKSIQKLEKLSENMFRRMNSAMFRKGYMRQTDQVQI